MNQHNRGHFEYRTDSGLLISVATSDEIGAKMQEHTGVSRKPEDNLLCDGAIDCIHFGWISHA